VSDNTTQGANTGRDADASDQIEAYQNLESLIDGAAGSASGPTHGSASESSNLEDNMKKFREFQQIQMLK